MANATWQDAIACPKCGLTGEQQRNVRQLQPQPGVTRGGRLYTFICRNSRCKWFNTPWEVQVNPDGTIPDPDLPRGEKRFKPLDPALQERARHQFENLQEAMIMQNGQAGEVRR